VVPVDLGREGLHDALRQFAHRLTKGRMIWREFEVQVSVI
jgi:hypothetical protein